MLTVKEWRKAKDFSVVKMAEMLEVSPTTWMKWEDDPSLIPIGKLDKFCELVGAELEQVIYRQETTRDVDCG